MAATNPTVVNMEVVAKGMPLLWDLDHSSTYDKLKNALKNNWKITKTPNSNDFRAPLQISTGGVYGAFNPEGGAFPETSGPAFAQMVQTAKSQAIGWDYNLSDEWYTENPSLSTVNITKNMLKDAMQAAKRAANMSFFSDGFTGGAQGLIAKGTAYDTGVFTLEGEFGANLVYPGMGLEIFEADLDPLRTAAVSTDLPKVLWVDPDNDKLKLTNLGAVTPQATDYLAIPGVGATPAWVHGLYYFNNPSTSGSILGLSKATYPQLVPVFENAAGGPISKVLMLKVQVKARQKRGKMVKYTGITHPVVAANWALEGTSISEFQRGSGQMGNLDLVPKGATEDTVTQAGVVHMLDPLASRKRADWINFENAGRVTLKEIAFLKNVNGGYLFQKRNSTASPVAAVQFWIGWSEDFVIRDPGENVVVYGGSGVIS